MQTLNPVFRELLILPVAISYDYRQFDENLIGEPSFFRWQERAPFQVMVRSQLA